MKNKNLFGVFPSFLGEFSEKVEKKWKTEFVFCGWWVTMRQNRELTGFKAQFYPIALKHKMPEERRIRKENSLFLLEGKTGISSG